MEYLGGPQLDFVIGHELGHVKGRHTRKEFSVVLLIFVGLVLLAFGLPLTTMYRPTFVLLALIVPLLAINAVSRHFEYACDREAVEFTGDPEAGLHALVNLYLMTGSPVTCNRIVELFMTHPSLVNRLEAITRAAKIPVGRASAVLIEAGLEGH